jgi:hypothetical protein
VRREHPYASPRSPARRGCRPGSAAPPARRGTPRSPPLGTLGVAGGDVEQGHHHVEVTVGGPPGRAAGHRRALQLPRPGGRVPQRPQHVVRTGPGSRARAPASIRPSRGDRARHRVVRRRRRRPAARAPRRPRGSAPRSGAAAGPAGSPRSPTRSAPARAAAGRGGAAAHVGRAERGDQQASGRRRPSGSRVDDDAQGQQQRRRGGLTGERQLVAGHLERYAGRPEHPAYRRAPNAPRSAPARPSATRACRRPGARGAAGRRPPRAGRPATGR